MRKQVGLFCCLLLGLVQAGNVPAADLPAPIDLPAGPASVEAPGGKNLPAMKGPAAPGAPAISAVGELTFPGETLVVCGDGLDGATLRVWAEGGLRDLDPLKSANDRMLALLPENLPVSTLLVWPVKDDHAGAPIRVNGATAWWAFPPRAAAATPGQTIRLMGKGLSLGGFQPRVQIEGSGQKGWLEVTLSNLYEIHAKLPADLKTGAYTVRAHNGSGGPAGWSEPMEFEVTGFPSREGLDSFRVDDFGARADDGKDDSGAIQAALEAAGKAGGGVVTFSAGTYHVSRPVHTPSEAPRGLTIAGAGRGEHTPKTHALGGTFTCLRWLDGAPFPAELLRVNARFTLIKGMNFFNAADGQKQICVSVRQFDCRVEDARFVVFERLPGVPGEARRPLTIDNGALHLEAPGESNTVIKNCDFHTPGAGVQIGIKNVFPSTDHVLISNCVFRGYFSGVYTIRSRDKRRSAGPSESGYRSCAMTNDCGKYTIVEGCDMAGADRYNGLVLGRTLQCHSSTVRGQFWVRNKAIHVANHSSLGKVNTNMGEQYMFHTSHDDAGLFDIIDAGRDRIVVNPADPKYEGERAGRKSRSAAGSVIPAEIEKYGHYVAYLCAGQGAGQYRIVTGVERAPGRVTLVMNRPWRVVPGTTSRAIVKVMYRQNIVFDCLADTGSPDIAHKSHGVIFWYDSVDNIVADNVFRNMTAGVIFNHSMRANTLWNLTRGNRMENMEGMTGDTSVHAAFYVNHYRPYSSWAAPPDRVWYSVGEVFRDNVCHGSKAAAAYLHTRFPYEIETIERTKGSFVFHPDGGIVMGVIENNVFKEVNHGVVVSGPANWSLIRNNKVTTTGAGRPKVFDQTLKKAVDPEFYLRIESELPAVD